MLAPPDHTGRTGAQVGDVGGPIGRASGCRVQLFAPTAMDPVRWRLLSSNNREIGRGAESYPDAESCRLAVKELQANLDALRPLVRRADANSWIWQLLLAGRLVALSAHGYDRQIRCARGVSQFRAELGAALVLPDLMTSHARRWGGSVA